MSEIRRQRDELQVRQADLAKNIDTYFGPAPKLRPRCALDAPLETARILLKSDETDVPSFFTLRRLAIVAGLVDTVEREFENLKRDIDARGGPEHVVAMQPH